MHDDPFARAVERAQAAEAAQDQERRDRRNHHVKSGARTAFRTHAAVFVMVNLLLVVIWATTSAGFPWFLYPLFGWGIGLVAHFAATQKIMGRSAARRAATAPHPAPATPAAQAHPTPAPASRSTAEELRHLGELHETGVLSNDEFRAAKSKLLS